ncbi:MAG: hypothetical protein L0Y58_08580 [Verrucomicrobia subdivision 3 bacterium]|nr:hypothetical protein [Limisphaerales bacterium]
MAKLFSHTLACLMAFAALPQTSNTLEWTTRNPRLDGPRLNAVAATESTCVAVGLQGQIIRSTDAVDWTPHRIDPARQLMDVIHVNGKFVAIGAFYDLSGAHSVALTSEDGQSWIEHPTSSRPWKSIVHGNGRFVAVGDHTIDTSVDGITWMRRTPHAYVNFYGIAFGNGIFVTMGVFHDGQGSYFYSVQRSADGVSWSGGAAPGAAVLRSIAFGNGLFVMVGDGGLIFTSSDGVEWTQRTSVTASTLHDVAFVDGKFLAVGNSGTITRSADGIEWFQSRHAGSQDLYGCGIAFGRFIAVGERSSIVTSPDQQAWTSASAVTDRNLRAVTFGNGRFVAVGENASAIYSSDGANWTARPVFESIGGLPITWFNSVAFGDNTFVTVGGQGAPTFTSPDATSWTQRYWNLGSDDLFGIAHGDGLFVAVGWISTGYGLRAGYRKSENGIDWTGGHVGPESPLRCITHGNGLWVASTFFLTRIGTMNLIELARSTAQRDRISL